MDDGIEAAALEPVHQFCRRHDIRKLPLGQVPPLAVMAKHIANRHVEAAGVIQRGHEIRSDKTGAPGHQQHDVSVLDVRCQLCPTPDAEATWIACRGEERAIESRVR